MKVKIYGAGSIGNHMAHAARQIGCDVSVCDVNQTALERMKNEIYPGRYNGWDEKIKLFLNKDAPEKNFDLIIIGTPPEYHLDLAMKSLSEKPKGILIEKPLCNPDLNGAQDLFEKANAGSTKVFVGYTHVVSPSLEHTEGILSQLGTIKTLDVEFREHWEGIFKAHPWLNGPQDSYLGYWKKGGGASGEHSHALNLWQHLAHRIEKGRVSEVSATMNYIKENGAEYDNLFFLTLKTEKGLYGRVIQDVVTKPSRKWAKIQGEKGAINWIANFGPQGDAVVHYPFQDPEIKQIFAKKRPDDFIIELRHILKHIENQSLVSPLRLERGLDTMLVLAAAHMSEREKRRVEIDYSKGYTIQALKTQGRN